MKFIKVMIAASLIVPLASFFLADADWTRRTHAIGTSLGENKYGLYLASVRAEILNDTPALEDFYAQAAEQNGGDFLGRLFILDALAGRENEAADRARQSLAENRGGVIPALYLAVGEFRKQNFAEASKLLGDIKGPDGAPTRSFAVRLFRGWTLMAEGKMDAAISLLDDDADNMAFEKTALVHLAWMAELAGKQDYAAELWGEAAAYWLDASEAKAAVDFYMRRGDRAKALSLMENFRVKAPSSVSFQMLSKKVGEDGYEPDTAPTPSQGFARALFEIANGILSLNRFDTADVYALYLDMALSLEPDMDIALLMRADAYRRSGNMEKFEETAAKIPASSYLRPFAELQLAQNSIKSKGAEVKSVARLESIIKAEPDILQAYSILGDYYKGKKEYEKALKVYTAGIEHGGADSIMGDLYFSRAGARDAMGDREAAGLDLDKAVELLPRNPVVLNYYGYFLISGQGDEDKAFGLIERAMAADPANPYYLDSYGWAFFKKGDRTRALKMLEYARALSPKNPVIIDHLASVYWSLGRYDEARFEWGKALEFFGSGDWNDSLTRRDIERRLEHGFEG